MQHSKRSKASSFHFFFIALIIILLGPTYKHNIFSFETGMKRIVASPFWLETNLNAKGFYLGPDL